MPHVLVEVPKRDELRVLDQLPERPRGPMELPGVVSLAARLHPRTQTTNVDACGDRWEIDARLGKIQPDATVWSVPFWIGSPLPLDLAVVARVFGDNIATPMEVPLTITIGVEEVWLEEEKERENEDGDEDDG